MHRHVKKVWPLAIPLAALAGYVDAIGFLRLGGFLVSFISGNSTRLAFGLASGSAVAPFAGALIGTFAFGAIAGSLVPGAAGSRRKVAVLIVVAALQGSAAAFAMIGYNRCAIAGLALATGAVNAVFQRDGEVSIGVTYMTGTLVKLAQGIADAMQGRGRWSWVPYLWLWLGLATGAVAGAGLYRALAMNALWIAAGAAALLSLFAARLSPMETWQSARPDKPI